MSDTIARDAKAVHHALRTSGNEVNVSLSRETAELLARVIDARGRGQQVILTRGDVEVTPNEAAELLGMSRPQVRKLMDKGLLDFRKVGAHHRIRLSSVQSFLDTERSRRKASLEKLAEVQNELGLTE